MRQLTMIAMGAMLAVACAACSSINPKTRTPTNVPGSPAAAITPPPVPAGGGSEPTCRSTPISWENADIYANTRAGVVGPVVSISPSTQPENGSLYLEIGKPRPQPNGLDIVIPGSVRSRFDAPPEDTFGGRSICVEGVITEANGRYQIVIGAPTEVTLLPAAAPTPARPGGMCNKPISWEDAAAHASEVVDVQGPVVGFRRDTSGPEPLTLIEIGVAGDEAGGVDVAIADASLPNFPNPPQQEYAGETICVEGAVSIVGGRARLYVDLPLGIKEQT